MKDNYSYSIQLRCVVCGSEDHLDYNEDKSYIKCTNCGKEYFGGYDELVVCNQDQIESLYKHIDENMKYEKLISSEALSNSAIIGENEYSV